MGERWRGVICDVMWCDIVGLVVIAERGSFSRHDDFFIALFIRHKERVKGQGTGKEFKG